MATSNPQIATNFRRMPTNKLRMATKISFVAISFVFVAIGGIPAVARAATLYFSPSSGSYTIGQTFSVTVYVSSADQAMNAASGVISFPQDKLEVVSLPKTGSIFTLWVQEPSFSNSGGMVNFEGIVLNPGFTGATGKIITINFRAKAAGTALLNFSSGSVLANDGKGTNILSSLGNASFSLGRAVPTVPEAITPAEAAGTPSAPQISSPTHPDPNKWYALKDIKFTWPVPDGITGARLLVGRIPTAVPTVTYIPPISSRALENLEDGIWYFSVRLRNDAGWGAISRFRFQIDTEKPSRFEMTEVEREDPTEPSATFVFDARDETSGIDYYEIIIDGGEAAIWKDDGSGRYTAPALGPGGHTLIAKAIDKAGNSLANSVEFTIVALEPPIITDYPKTLASGEPLVIKGITKYPNAQTAVWFERENEEAKSQIARNDNEGNFTLVAEEKLKDGIYKVWAEVIDERGGRSTASEKVTISIERPAFLKLGSWAISLLAVIVPLVALIILLLAILYYGWHKFSSFRKKVRKETIEAEKSLHQAFRALKEETEEQVAKLDGKPDLSEREKKICDSLKKALRISEQFIGKEIEDIEKAVK
jgi:hypothetical protein